MAGGDLAIYNGRMPSDSSNGLSNQKELARLRIGAWSAATDGAAVALSVEPDEVATGGGVPRWFRVYSNTGLVVMDGRVGDDLILDTEQIPPGSRVTVSRFSYRVRM